MRLPQSSSQPFSIRVISILSLIVLSNLLPLCARAATQQLVPSPTSLRFGTVTVGQVETQLVVLTNSGQSSVTLSAVKGSASGFGVSGLSLPATLPAGQSLTLSVTFSPIAAGWISGSLTFTSNASNPSLQVPVAGAGVTSEPLIATPASLSFGSVGVGGSATLSVVLTNARSHKETLTAFQPVGSEFSVSGPTLPVTLNVGQSVTLSITFTPSAVGLAGGSVFVLGPSLNIPLTGTGSTIGQLSIAPGSLSFGSVEVGTKTTQSSAMTAVGGSVTVSSASSNSSQFSITGASFPLTISAGQSVPFTVTFTPQSMGAASGSLSFASSGSTSRTVESVAGTGTGPSVSLSWIPSTSEVSGYYVYRGTSSKGPYSRLNATPDASTSFVDAAVASGQTYYYVTTAVNSSGQESIGSNQAQAQVP